MEGLAVYVIRVVKFHEIKCTERSKDEGSPSFDDFRAKLLGFCFLVINVLPTGLLS